jgi:hypothetical protein
MQLARKLRITKRSFNILLKIMFIGQKQVQTKTKIGWVWSDLRLDVPGRTDPNLTKIAQAIRPGP